MNIRLIIVMVVVSLLASFGQTGEASPERQTGAPTLILTHAAQITGANWSPDGRWIASWGFGYVYIWDVLSGVRVASMSQDTSAEPLWSPDSRWLATWEQDTLSIWSTEAIFQEYASLPFDGIETVEWSPDSSRIAILAGYGVVPISVLAGDNSASEDNRMLHIWSLERQADDYLWGIPRKMSPGELAWSPDGRNFVVRGLGEVSLLVWDLTTGLEIQELRQPLFFTMQWSKNAMGVLDGRILLGGVQGGVAMFDIAGRSESYRVLDESFIWQIFVSPDKTRFVAMLNAARRLPIYGINTGDLMQTLRSDYFFKGAEWSHDGQFLLTSHMDGNVGGLITIWHVDTGVAQMIIPFTGIFDQAHWSADTTKSAVVVYVGFLESTEVIVWDSLTGIEQLRLPLPLDSNAVWHPSMNRLLVWTNANFDCETDCKDEVQVWDFQ